MKVMRRAKERGRKDKREANVEEMKKIKSEERGNKKRRLLRLFFFSNIEQKREKKKKKTAAVRLKKQNI